MLVFNHFEVGDIVKIKRSLSDSNPFRKERDELFKIADISGGDIRLDWRIELFSIDEISPIMINQKEDAVIHLKKTQPNHAYVLDGMQQQKDSILKEYYLDSMHKLGWSKLLELIRSKDILYVNQVQRYIQNFFKGYTLEFEA